MKQPDDNGKKIKCRAFELDMLRGLAVLMMMLHHFIFDLRYLLGLNIFAFQEAWWFDSLLRPVFLFIFLGVSGVCCTFSRSNSKRALKMILAALLLTVATVAVWLITDLELAIFFNILHLLAFGTLIYSLLEKKISAEKVLQSILIAAGSVLIWAATIIPYAPRPEGYLLLPLGFLPQDRIVMGDYMPILPWLGFFFIGAALGRLLYAGGCSLFPNAPQRLLKVVSPLTWLGRNALMVYIFHQPIILLILFGLRQIGLI